MKVLIAKAEWRRQSRTVVGVFSNTEKAWEGMKIFCRIVFNYDLPDQAPEDKRYGDWIFLDYGFRSDDHGYVEIEISQYTVDENYDKTS